MYNLECHANMTKAKYELHLVNAHGDKRHESGITENLAIIARKGRLKT